jgi:nitronate monooxygenase
VTPEPSGRTFVSTTLCHLLGIRYPIIQAPMAGGWTTPELVAAVSNAGGFGVLAGARVSPETLRVDIQATKALTNRPFGVNFLLAPPEPGNRDVETVQPCRLDGRISRFHPRRCRSSSRSSSRRGVSVLSTALGDPGDLIERTHARGMLVISMVTTVEEAVRVAERGADVVVAQGAEAGGHRSTFELGSGGEVPLVGTMALVPQVVDAVDVPVVAAGGISDGRGLLAVLALGAAGALMGTRFLLARESGAHPAYRKRLLDATEEDTLVTRAFTGRPARGLRNRFVEEYLSDGPEPLAWPLQSVAAGDIYGASQAADNEALSLLLAGQGLRMLKKHDQGAAEIVGEAGDRLLELGGALAESR